MCSRSVFGQGGFLSQSSMKILHKDSKTAIYSAADDSIKETVESAVVAGVHLRGANLRDADLNYANLAGADLCLADLLLADLAGANLLGANLSRADLRGANLRGANLIRADLRGANLRGANMCGADLRCADLRDADLSGADIHGADLRGADLRDAKGFFEVQKMPIRANICARVCQTPEALNMMDWHTCDTVHCLAGWAVTLHPQGVELEKRLGTPAAASLLFHVCEGEVPEFYSNEQTAMNWLKKQPE